MDHQIRIESPSDEPAISDVQRAAFGREAEASLVMRLRNDGLIVASIVAESESKIVGSAVFSKLAIVSGSSSISAVALAPVAVHPNFQRQNVGTRIIEFGLRFCREKGYSAAIVLGDPVYYSRFGFTAELTSALRCAYSGPHWMGLELIPGTLHEARGFVEYPDAFQIVG